MKKRFGFISLFLILFLSVFLWLDYLCAACPADCAYYDLKPLLRKEMLTEEDYKIIFQQTGLGKSAVEDIKNGSFDLIFAMERFQRQRLRPLYYQQSFMLFPILTAEQLLHENGVDRSLILPPLRKGDILLTRSTKTILYRHGHVAMVIDAEEGITAEAMAIGSTSQQMPVDFWQYFPTLLILRPKASAESVEMAVDYAEKYLMDVPYRLFTGLLQKDKSQEAKVDSTQCAHLVWQAFKAAGIDIDGDGGWLVTPDDIMCSPELEVIFSFGYK